MMLPGVKQVHCSWLSWLPISPFPVSLNFSAIPPHLPSLFCTQPSWVILLPCLFGQMANDDRRMSQSSEFLRGCSKWVSMDKLQQSWEGPPNPYPLGVSLKRVPSFSWTSKIFRASRKASHPAGMETCPMHPGTNPTALLLISFCDKFSQCS